jgi:hypothetical protein
MNSIYICDISHLRVKVGNRKGDRNMENPIGTGYGLNAPKIVARLSAAASYSSLVQSHNLAFNADRVPSPQG